MSTKKVAVIGSGGREAAIARKLLSEGHKVFMLPGNAGLASWMGLQQIPCDPSNVEGLVQIAKMGEFDLTIVGPEAPLALGVVDRFTALGLPIVGPTKAAAKLETSKVFSSQFMARHGIPAPKFAIFEQGCAQEAKLHVDHAIQHKPVVVKAEGLMAGKGVVVTQNREEAYLAIERLLDSGRILIQQHLVWEECSFIVLTDGKHALPLPVAQDYKTLHEGNRGPMTGGMGSWAPCPMDEELTQRIMTNIVYPTLRGMEKEDALFRGFLYCGLILTKEGPKVLEYNVRNGDPETQSQLAVVESNIYDLLFETTQGGTLKNRRISLTGKYVVTITLSAEGYPSKPVLGDEITGIEDVVKERIAEFFPAGVAMKEDKLITSGGRVGYVTATGSSLKIAASKALAAANLIRFRGKHFRTDIAASAALRAEA